MGWISMSEQDLKRVEVLSEVLSGRRTVTAAASVLAVSERQAYRLLAGPVGTKVATIAMLDLLAKDAAK
jgi:hypothetical protein